jgi:signal transduction histidine kinase
MRNLGRVRQMIDDLLDHSRASTGERLQLRFEPVELRGLIGEVVSDLRASHGDRYILQSPGDIAGVWCPDALKRAVFNLAENATKYGDPDSPVTITLTDVEGSVSISVHNRGSPIPPEERRSLFQPFRRGSSDRASQRPGWGLGLTAVKEIAEAHGGSVMVESTVEEGTTFTLQVFRDCREFSPDRSGQR